MRILLFLATNLAVILVASISLSLLGFNSFMAANGIDLNLSAIAQGAEYLAALWVAAHLVWLEYISRYQAGDQ